MIFINTITKNDLQQIIYNSFVNFGFINSAKFLDSIKYLGFHFATISGISINIEDLKISKIKIKHLQNIEKKLNKINTLWISGYLSNLERFQNMLTEWSLLTDLIKQQIINYYKHFNPANNLYIMAFSGARGNLEQVRQLITIRGLMSDQEGKIIDLPIKTNFKEGLNLVDYIISSYGARKGLVDTALKTADSGYLTRRLVYAGQNLIIKQKNCKTNKGILIFLNNKNNFKFLLGRIIITYNSKFFKNLNFNNKLLTTKLLNFFIKKNVIFLILRSVITCESKNSICQTCYGWDLSKKKIISLGESVGVLAAQSIGEPGTQLTMRTFHTGGIFTENSVIKIKAPFSGNLFYSTSLHNNLLIRNHQGVYGVKVKKNCSVFCNSWDGSISQELKIPKNAFLYIYKSSLIFKNQILGEYSKQDVIHNLILLKPVYSLITGELSFNFNILKKKQFNKNYFLNNIQEIDNILWINSGNFYFLPKEIKFLFFKNLKKNQTFSYLKIISPKNGICFFNKNYINIFNKKCQYKFNINKLIPKIKNCFYIFLFLIKNYQYIYNFSILIFFNFYLKTNIKIYFIKKKESILQTILFFVTEKNIWSITNEEINNLNFIKNKKIFKNQKINNLLKSNLSGFLLTKNGYKYYFQKSLPIFIKKNTLLRYKNGDFIYKKNILGLNFNYTQKLNDIVQGLPKIEELFELKNITNNEIYLNKFPGIFFNFFKIYKNIEICYEFLFKNKIKLFNFKFNNFELNNLILYNCLNFKQKIKSLSYINITNPNNFIFNSGNFIDIGENLIQDNLNIEFLLKILFYYHKSYNGIISSTIKSKNKFELLFLNSIQAIYKSQQVDISNIHLELIISQMLDKIIILENNNTPFIPGEILSFSILKDLYILYNKKDFIIRPPSFEPILLSLTETSLKNIGFLSSASFQETKKILAEASILGPTDWFNGLKESIIANKQLPAGSSFFTYKNYLDKIYFFKYI